MNNKEYDDEMEIDLGALFHVLIRKWWLIAICAIMGGVIALGGTALLITPKYESKAQLYILNKTTSVTSLSEHPVSIFWKMFCPLPLLCFQ